MSSGIVGKTIEAVVAYQNWHADSGPDVPAKRRAGAYKRVNAAFEALGWELIGLPVLLAQSPSVRTDWEDEAKRTRRARKAKRHDA